MKTPIKRALQPGVFAVINICTTFEYDAGTFRFVSITLTHATCAATCNWRASLTVRASPFGETCTRIMSAISASREKCKEQVPVSLIHLILCIRSLESAPPLRMRPSLSNVTQRALSVCDVTVASATSERMSHNWGGKAVNQACDASGVPSECCRERTTRVRARQWGAKLHHSPTRRARRKCASPDRRLQRALA